MNRKMVARETGNLTQNRALGVLVTQVGQGETPTSEFWVSREEAPELIRLLADTFDLDVELHE